MPSDHSIAPPLGLALSVTLLVLGMATQAAVPGGIEVVTLPSDATGAFYAQRPVMIVNSPDPVAVVGIPLDAAPGQGILDVESGARGRLQITFDVTRKSYPVQRLTIANQKMVNPPQAELARIERETALMTAQYDLFTALPASPFPLSLPASGPVSSNFGLRRILNGEPRNPHAGLDIAAKTGDPVTSPAPGTVSLTGSFYFNGNTIFVNHGGGLISMVCHLSAIEVHDGDVLARGQRIGRVGATGRATGPHLHWSVSLNGQRVDPTAAVALFAPPA
jgi:murein DD-endopeptidase MepM/ murein hydrolase activator NlpD